jgi:magnesium-transporting ATPase (P-type)
MSVRNTEHVYGVVVFTGHETKIMQNSAAAKYKFSRLELLTNQSILVVLCVQVFLAVVASLSAHFWERARVTQEDPKNEASSIIVPPYLNYEGLETIADILGPFQVLQKVGTWILIFTNLVPISLLVTLELVKLWQANFMTYDCHMFDEEQDMQMRAQSSNLNEELGQVEYVFSDKTGTLTCNLMEFKKFTAGKVAYGTGSSPPPS